MNWYQFKEALQKNTTQHLQFEYADQHWVAAHYHITEIKQAQIISVDCGGRKDIWYEVILQLWEPEKGNEDKPMKAEKALKIIDQVETVIALHPQATVKIEYGNPEFGTRQMDVNSIRQEQDNLLIYLRDTPTQCKASDVCGKPKEKVKLSALSEKEICCSPEAGCC